MEENIGLNSIDQSYNYNSAVPNSPPPSFHSSQSVDVPLRSNNATPTNTHDLLGDTRPLTGSVIGSATGSEALVINLHKRIERLEETVGRLLLEVPSTSRDSSHSSGHSNCCVTFSDPGNASELATMRGGSNCCVSFKSRREISERERNGIRIMKVTAAGIFLVMVWTVLLAFARRPVCGNCTPDA